MPRTLTWLHLSDLHACPRDGWESKPVTDSLVEDIKLVAKKQKLRPDLVFFTGDAAWGNHPTAKATLSEQFDIAEQFFESIRSAFSPPLDKTRFYIVPGNHDVDRTRIHPAITPHLDGMTLDKITNEFRDGGAAFAFYMDRLHAYRDFLGRRGYTHILTDKERLIFSHSFNHIEVGEESTSSVRVGIAGFNSAWTCGRPDEKGKLWLCGKYQQNILHGDIESAAIKIALIHHPFNWLRSEEDPAIGDMVRRNFHFLLHGHEHQPRVITQRSTEKPPHPHTTISAGAAYDGGELPKAYNFVRLDLQSGKGEVFQRVTSYNGHGWAPAIDEKNAPKGIWPIQCPKISQPKSAPAATPPVTKQPFAPAKGLLAHLKPPTLSGDEYLGKFCSRVATYYNYLELPGITINAEEAKQYELTVAYVSLSLSSMNSGHEQVTSRADEVLSELPAKAPRLLISGDAGCGKTTLMRWFAVLAGNGTRGIFPGKSPDWGILVEGALKTVSSARTVKDLGDMAKGTWAGLIGSLIQTDALHSVPGAAARPSLGGNWSTKVPILIRLRDFPSGKLPALTDLARYLAPNLSEPSQDYFGKLFESGAALILLDGVDEVPPTNRPKLEREIDSWMTAFPKCHFVISSRPDAVGPKWLAKQNVTRAEVQPLSPRDRDTFIDFWHKAVTKNCEEERRKLHIETTRKKLLLELKSNAPVARLMTNPLLAASICALNLDDQGQLPRNEWEVCNKLVDMLLNLRVRHDPNVPDDKIEWGGYELLSNSQNKLPILSNVACEMLDAGRSSLPTTAVDGIVAATLALNSRFHGLDEKDIRQQFVSLSGLLRVGKGDEIEFIHNIFKEFVAAEKWAMSETRHLLDLAHHASEAAWQPVLRFIAMRAAQNPERLARFVRKILTLFPRPKAKQQEARRKNRPAHLLLVQIAADSSLEPALQKEIAILRAEFLPPRTFSDAMGIAACGEVAIPHLRRLAKSTPKHRVACVRALGLIEVEAASEALDEYMIDECPEVLAELARYRNALAFPSVQAALRTKGELPDWCPKEHIRDLSPLAALKDLASLDLQRCTNAADLGPLRSLKVLQSLDCSNTQVATLEPLQDMKRMQRLHFAQTKVDKLDEIRQLTQLRSIGFGGTEVNNLEPLRDLKGLNRISLWRTKVRSLEPLREMKQLKALICGNTAIKSLEPIEGLTQLTEVTCWSTLVESLEPLRNLEALEELDCWNTKVSCLEPLRELTQLKFLDCTDTDVTDFEPICSLQRLTKLVCDITASINVSSLARLNGLQKLVCHITDENQFARIESLARLTVVKTSAAQSERFKAQFNEARRKLKLGFVKFE